MKVCRFQPFRRFTAIISAAVLAMGLLTGCGQGKEDKGGGGNPVKGRYVEENVELPIQDGEEITNLEKSGVGNPVLYSQTESMQVFRYEYKDGQWERTSLDWAAGIFDGQAVYIQEVQETGDGTQVLRAIDEEMCTHLVRGSDGKTGEKLGIAYLEQPGEYGFPAIIDMQIDGGGNYWMYDMYQAKIVVIDRDSLEIIHEINGVQALSSMQRVLFGAENGDMAVNTEEGIFTVYSSDLTEKGTLKAEQTESGQMCNDDEENWYLISETGITRITAGNETSEVIMDGSMGEMSSSTNYTAGFISGQDHDFYALYQQAKAATYSLVHYVYDAGAPAVPEHTLKVFGLSENQTVQDAVLGFQKTHPDVKVEFQTSGKEEGITKDDIRTLNTELLSGNGADVLLLDGLPTDAYIEKGMLADLTELADGLTAKEAYLEPVLRNAAQKEGKIYGMPVKFSIPIIYGDEQVKAAFASLESLKTYVEEHPDQSVVGVAERDYIRDFLFQLYQDEVIGEKGKVDQKKLTELLEVELKIAENARTEAFDDVETNELGMGVASQIFHQGIFSNAGSAAILNHPNSISTDPISGMPDMMIPYAIMRQMNLSPDTLNDFYIPEGIVGINQNSDQIERAEEFVKYLFSAEVQEKPLDDGLPVLEAGLNRLKEEVDSEYAQSLGASSSWNIEGEAEISVDAGYPTREEVEDLIAKCHTVGRPAIQECVVWNIYQTEADACLRGSMDAETAAKNIAQKVDTYLAE